MSRNCQIDGCSGKREKRGMCSKHYWRWRIKGDPLAEPTPPIASLAEAAQRYIAKCTWVGDCLVLRDNGKYGEVSWGPKVNRNRMTAHRAVFVTMCGPLDDDEVTRHRCDNPPCVNPAHLEAGSVAENSRDMYERNRRAGSRSGARGEANKSAVLTEELVVSMRREVRAGNSIRQVARNYGHEYSSVYRAVRGKSWGHVQEPAVGQVREGHPNPARTPDDVAQLAASLAADGLSLGQIGERLGINRVTAHRVIKRLEVA